MELTAPGATPTAQVPALGSLHHIGITVTDLALSVAWYGDALGLVPWMEETYPGGRTVGLMRPGTSVFVGLDEHEANLGERFSPSRTGLDHLAFGVDSREELLAWRAHLTGSGVACSEVDVHGGPAPFALFTFSDPDGVALEIIHMG